MDYFRDDELLDAELFDALLGPALEGVGELIADNTGAPSLFYEDNGWQAQAQALIGQTVPNASSTAAVFSSSPKEQGTRKPRRKRGPTSQQQVAELQKTLQAHQATHQGLQRQNLWLAERVQMLELVIIIKDAQLARLHEVQAGLKFNPFENLNCTPEELHLATPAFVAGKFVEVSSKMAIRIASVVPYLQQHQYLLWGPTPETRWPHTGPSSIPQLYATNGPPAPAGAGVPGQGAGLGASLVSASVLRDVEALVTMFRELEGMFRYMWWVNTKLLLAVSVHVHAIDPVQNVPWDQLWNSLSLTPGKPSNPQAHNNTVAPPVAPEDHWVKVVDSLMLTDKQKLQAAALHDLINDGMNSIVSQQKHLSEAMLGLQQQNNPGPGLAVNEALSQTSFHSHSLSSSSACSSAPVTADGGAAAAAAARVGAGGGGGVTSSLGAVEQAILSGTQSEPVQTGCSDLLPGASTQGMGSRGAQSTVSGNLGVGASSVLGAQGGGHGVSMSVVSRCMTDSTDRMNVQLQEDAIVKKLQMTLIKQRCFAPLVQEALVLCILTPVQGAMAAVNSYPYVPDDLAMLNAMWRLCTPEVLDRLASAAAVR